MIGKVNIDYFAICPIDNPKLAKQAAEQLADAILLEYELGRLGILLEDTGYDLEE